MKNMNLLSDDEERRKETLGNLGCVWALIELVYYEECET